MKRGLAVLSIALGLSCGAASAQTGAVTAASAESNRPAPQGPVYVIPIRGPIEQALLYVIRRGASEADEKGARAVVFVMDTPGGTVDAAREIVHIIQRIPVPTYTFVEKNAFSAGAIIALATRNIYMAPGSVIGDAMPILMNPTGGVEEMPEALQEKSESAVSALIRAAAEQGGHNKELAEAMVRRTGEYKIGDTIIKKEGQLLTLTNEEAERKVGENGRPLLSAGTVDSVSTLLARVGLGEVPVVELEVTATERIARFIAALGPLLLIVGGLLIYLEFKTPGFGLPGILGGVCLVVFFWGHHIAGLAGYEEVLIFLIGLILLAVELLFIPGFGLLGILGLVMMLGSLFYAMVQNIPDNLFAVPDYVNLNIPLIKLMSSIVGLAAGGWLLGRVLPNTPFARRLVLSAAVSREDGYAASDDTAEWVGRRGVSAMPLRPSGVAEFGDRRVDVMTRGEFVDSGVPVVVVEAQGSRIFVEAAGDNTGGNA